MGGGLIEVENNRKERRMFPLLCNALANIDMPCGLQCFLSRRISSLKTLKEVTLWWMTDRPGGNFFSSVCQYAHNKTNEIVPSNRVAGGYALARQLLCMGHCHYINISYLFSTHPPRTRHVETTIP